jgi:hypothetical protein
MVHCHQTGRIPTDQFISCSIGRTDNAMANPLKDIANTQRIMAVVTRGRLLNREALDGLLAKADRSARED